MSLLFRKEMGQIYTPVFILSLIFLLNSVQCQRQCRSRSNPLNSLLKNVLSPGNLELLKQRKVAAARNNYPNVLPNIVPANVLPNAYMPPNVLPNSYIPANMLPNSYIPANMLPNSVIPANMLPNSYIPTNMLPNVPICPKQVKPRLVEAVDVPKRICANPVPIQAPVVIKEQPALPAPLINPFLPAASPVSALAPTTSSLLPPADYNNCRCNFLRKIPIPPPTL